MSVAAVAQSPAIQFDGASFQISGWRAPTAAPAKGWASIFVVYAGTGDVPPLLGSYSVEGGTLVFRPRYPVSPGVRYRAVFHPPAGLAIEKTIDTTPKAVTPSAKVEHIYPSADVLPGNQLRLYIVFSAPMSRGESAARIRLLDDAGKVQQGIFLPGQELWDPTFTRLTMTFDPGRIKRGLTSNQALGPPITEGKRYKLVIDKDWRDARGVPMTEGFTKVFRGGPQDRATPDPSRWRVTPPTAGSTAPAVIDFPEPMNYALLNRMIRVQGLAKRIDGTIDLQRQESQWRFTPNKPWQPGDYQLIIDTAIEDLAGNHIGQAFDIDIFDHVTERMDSTTISLPFRVH